MRCINGYFVGRVVTRNDEFHGLYIDTSFDPHRNADIHWEVVEGDGVHCFGGEEVWVTWNGGFMAKRERPAVDGGWLLKWEDVVLMRRGGDFVQCNDYVMVDAMEEGYRVGGEVVRKGYSKDWGKVRMGFGRFSEGDVVRLSMGYALVFEAGVNSMFGGVVYAVQAKGLMAVLEGHHGEYVNKYDLAL